jgi:hypothetical protein
MTRYGGTKVLRVHQACWTRTDTPVCVRAQARVAIGKSGQLNWNRTLNGPWGPQATVTMSDTQGWQRWVALFLTGHTLSYLGLLPLGIQYSLWHTGERDSPSG